MKRTALFCAVASALLVLMSCSGTSTPPAPQKGTPAFYWSAAKERYAAGDYMKTIEHLEKLVATENEYTAKARPWLLVVMGGVTDGYIDYADFFEGGGRMNKANPSPFRRQMSDARNSAGRMSLQLLDQIGTFAKSAGEKIALDFPFPNGNTGRPPALMRASTGVMLGDAEIEPAQKAAMTRAVLLQTCMAVGAKEDPAKTSKVFEAGNVQVSKNDFMLMLANDLNRSAQLFSSQKLDEPQKLKALAEKGLEIVKPLPDSKEKKEMEKALAATLKTKK